MKLPFQNRKKNLKNLTFINRFISQNGKVWAKCYNLAALAKGKDKSMASGIVTFIDAKTGKVLSEKKHCHYRCRNENNY